jgi:hypothetical protein
VIAFPFGLELRKMLIAAQLIKDPRTAKTFKNSSQPSIAELNRRAALSDNAKTKTKGQNYGKTGPKQHK